jgi:predicted ATPase
MAAAPEASADAESERYLLFGAVVDLLARISLVAPVVLVLDDLQWADRPTIQLLRHLVSSDVAMRLVVVGTFRDSEITTTHPLADALAALHREEGVERIALRGLGDDELLSLLESIAGHEMASDGLQMRDALLAETEGNPFFVHEMLRHLAETGAILQDGSGRWVATPALRASGMPVSIREVVERRISGLGDETARVLSVASVIGRDFDVEVLAGCIEMDDDVLLDLCDDAVRASVLTDSEMPGRYTFAHALIQHTLYDGLSTGRRARTHRLVAEALEEICGDEPGPRIGELAHHWSQATRPDDGIRALDYTRRARTGCRLGPGRAWTMHASHRDPALLGPCSTHTRSRNGACRTPT